MVIVIQCAASKVSNAGSIKTQEGKPVKFVAQPHLAPVDNNVYARPDDVSDCGGHWRDFLSDYNSDLQSNLLGLLPAYKLYKPKIYQNLANYVGQDRLFILSAGWGLVRSDFLIPDYDITFSKIARAENSYKRRRPKDKFNDYYMLPKNLEEPILFFGGHDYLPLFLHLTDDVRVERSIFYISTCPPEFQGCKKIYFQTRQKTNWHYLCAEKFINGDLKLV